MEVVNRILADMPHYRQRVRMEGDEDAVTRFDPVFLALALRNLIENAVSHSEGAVLVRGNETDGRMEIAVEDEGPGIPADELPSVTQRFFRGRGRSVIGSGLGLAIAQEAIARIGGALELKNRDPHGLAATLSIPAKAG